jgi:hypothetical protein
MAVRHDGLVGEPHPVNRPATITVPPSSLSQKPRSSPYSGGTSRMSIFAHPHAIAAASTPVAKCVNCRQNEVVIVDLQAWVDDLSVPRPMARVSS